MGDSESNDRKNGVIDDPVYGQPGSKSEDSPGPERKDGTDRINPEDDPVYSQSRTSSSPSQQSNKNNAIIDPVYGQFQSTPPDALGARQQKSSGRIDAETDPVYSQSRTAGSDNGKNTNSQDPVYGQSQSRPSDAPLPKRAAGTGVIDAENDPVYSQDHTKSSPSSSSANSRLQQLSSHVSPTQSEPDVSRPGGANTKRVRRRRSKTKIDSSAELPADYSDILTHLSTMRRIANTPDTNNRGYQRQKTAGKLWARERIAQLLDPSTWREIGSVAGTATWRKDDKNPQSEHVEDFIPTNNPQGFGRITCPRTGQKRQIYLTVDDFSIRSGHADGSNGLKTLHGEKLALQLKVPVVKLVDGSSGGGSVTTIQTNGYSYIPNNGILWTAVKQLNAGIPNLGAVCGPAIGLGAARVVSTHFSVMAGDIGALFNAGPKVVEGATFEEDLSFQDLGGPQVHCTNGTIDNLAANEAECFQQIRIVLGYLPDCGMFQAPPTVQCNDNVNREDTALRSIIPRRKGRGYNPWKIIESVVDQGSWFEIGRLWGRTAITGLARLGGRPVGVMSLNCEVNSGALDAGGSQKMMKMLKFCDVFNLPILQFVDIPGYAIGTVAERSATMKWGVALAMAYYSTTTPIFSVVTRRVYGVAGGVMLDSRDPMIRVAWPSGNWGSLPLDGGIEVGHRHELKEIGKTAGPDAVKQRYRQLEDEYLRLMNPVRTANAFGIEEIIDPKDTRRIACRWAKEVYGHVMQERLADRASGKINPVFT